MLPELFTLCKPPLPAPRTLLPTEEVDPRRAMRLVWMLPTGSGLVVCDRRAAAAAAEDREACDDELARKAWPAAAVAALMVLRSRGGFELARRPREKRAGMIWH